MDFAKNIKLTIAYDGTDFSGWQRQKGVRTIQGEIENALEKLHKRHIPLAGAGRTDAGVHATGQCANFFSTIKNIKAGNFVPALNGILAASAPGIRIISAREVPDSFHARFSAVMRTYRYYFVCGRPAMPDEIRYVTPLQRQPDISLLNDYASLLSGETDCSLFASPSDDIFLRGSGSKTRFFRNAVFFMENGKLIFEISANAFFRKMVRSIAGTFLFYEEKRLGKNDFETILRRGLRSDSGPVAIPNGLFLREVGYGN